MYAADRPTVDILLASSSSLLLVLDKLPARHVLLLAILGALAGRLSSLYFTHHDICLLVSSSLYYVPVRIIIEFSLLF